VGVPFLELNGGFIEQLTQTGEERHIGETAGGRSTWSRSAATSWGDHDNLDGRLLVVTPGLEEQLEGSNNHDPQQELEGRWRSALCLASRWSVVAIT
jgi:hypothetical protein